MNKVTKQEREAKKTIAACDWFTYWSPSITLNIKFPFLDRLGKHLGDALLATRTIAEAAVELLPQLNKWKFGQAELLLTEPVKEAWHFCICEKQLYASDQEFYPYD